MNWRNFSAILFGLLLIAIGIIIWMFRANSSNQQSAALDRDRLITAAKQKQIEDDSIRSAERHFRDSTHKASAALKNLYISETAQRQAGLKELRLIRIALGIKPDTVTVQIEGKMTAQRGADSLEIIRLEGKIFSDSGSFERDLAATNDKYLQQVVISDQHLEHVQELQTDLKKERKIKTVYKVLAVVGLSLFAYESIRD